MPTFSFFGVDRPPFFFSSLPASTGTKKNSLFSFFPPPLRLPSPPPSPLGNLHPPCAAWEEAQRRPPPAAATGTSRRWQPRASSTAMGLRPVGPCAPSATAGAAVSPAAWAPGGRGDPWTRSRRRGRARGELIAGRGRGRRKRARDRKNAAAGHGDDSSFVPLLRSLPFYFPVSFAQGG